MLLNDFKSLKIFEGMIPLLFLQYFKKLFGGRGKG